MPDQPKNSDPLRYRYQDINYSLMRRMASAMQEGWERYEQDKTEPWEKNYLTYDTEKALNRLSNAICHLFQLNDIYLSRLRGVEPIALQEDHLGHCAANLNMLAEWERRGVLPSSVPEQQEESTVLCRICCKLWARNQWDWNLGMCKVCSNAGKSLPGPVTDAQESKWRALGMKEMDIIARIAARGKASSPEDRKAVINGTCQGCGRDAHLEDGTVRHEKPYRGPECVFEGRALDGVAPPPERNEPPPTICLNCNQEGTFMRCPDNRTRWYHKGIVDPLTGCRFEGKTIEEMGVPNR